MSCKRYWREGIVLAERGEPDPHRESCVDCCRAHAARHELVRAIPMAHPAPRGDSDWQARVWQQIAGEGRAAAPPPSASRWWWSLPPALAMCAALVLWLRPSGPVSLDENESAQISSADGLPRIEIISGPVVKRSASARVGDGVRIWARPGDDIRVYRAERLLMRCTAKMPSADCIHTRHSIVAETAFPTPGEYQLVVIPAMEIEPVGSLSADLAPVTRAGGDPQITDLSIR